MLSPRVRSIRMHLPQLSRVLLERQGDCDYRSSSTPFLLSCAAYFPVCTSRLAGSRTIWKCPEPVRHSSAQLPFLKRCLRYVHFCRRLGTRHVSSSYTCGTRSYQSPARWRVSSRSRTRSPRTSDRLSSLYHLEWQCSSIT